MGGGRLVGACVARYANGDLYEGGFDGERRMRVGEGKCTANGVEYSWRVGRRRAARRGDDAQPLAPLDRVGHSAPANGAASIASSREDGRERLALGRQPSPTAGAPPPRRGTHAAARIPVGRSRRCPHVWRSAFQADDRRGRLAAPTGAGADADDPTTTTTLTRTMSGVRPTPSAFMDFEYSGEWVRGKMHGSGRLELLSTGDVIRAPFRDGAIDGHASITLSTGGVSIEGRFEGLTLHGRAIVRQPRPVARPSKAHRVAARASSARRSRRARRGRRTCLARRPWRKRDQRAAPAAAGTMATSTAALEASLRDGRGRAHRAPRHGRGHAAQRRPLRRRMG